MSNFTNLVPPLELCKLIPEGEFENSALGHHRYCIKDGKEYYEVVQRGNTHSLTDVQYPAPTLQEILEELHKLQKDVFLKWSETAYHEWLVNAYTHNSDDYQAHDRSLVIAAIKVWLKMKGIEV